MYPANFEYVVPGSVQEAIAFLEEHPDAKALAGGHSLIPSMKLRLAEPTHLVDLGRLPGMRGLEQNSGDIVVGALTTHAEVAQSPRLTGGLAVLAQAAGLVGDVQVRNLGTIGGSAAHADPNADEPVALLALDATFGVNGASGHRSVAADDFFIDIFTTSLEPSDILTEIRLPRKPSGAVSAYAKFPHPASGYVVVSAAAVLHMSNGVCQGASIALGGVSGRPVRATGVERALAGKRLDDSVINAAAAHASEGIDPEGDLFASAEYKTHLSVVFAGRAIRAALQQAS
jgi:carbon-monoxide dehydrogenase medium subunit